MSAELSLLKTQRTQLKATIAAGVGSMSVDGQSVSYASMRDMRAILADLESQISALEGSANKRPRVSSVNMSGGV